MVKIASVKKTGGGAESRAGAVSINEDDFALILSATLGDKEKEDSLGVYSLIKLLANAAGDAQAQINLIQTSKGKIRKLLIAEGKHSVWVYVVYRYIVCRYIVYRYIVLVSCMLCMLCIFLYYAVSLC